MARSLKANAKNSCCGQHKDEGGREGRRREERRIKRN
jgi:hypothetical protein